MSQDKMLFDAVIFDLDGVLVDSSAVITRSWQAWAAKNAIDEDLLFQFVHGRRAAATIELAAPHLDAQAEARKLVIIESNDTEGLAVYPGVLDLLARIPRDRWSIYTSGTDSIATTRLKFAGIAAPAVFLTADRVANGKPAPDGYLMAAEQMGFAPENCLVIEDSPAGIRAAKAGGLSALAVGTTHDRAALAEADFWVPALADIRLTESREQDGGGLRLSLQHPPPA
jgi:sugar-phosphatase|tara:strand:+ start:14328 stop:15008 length:681 start_codon:yes stop_codon:yes gene_type:complete